MSVLCLLFVLVKRTVMTISINLQLYVQLMNNEQTSDNVGTLGQHIIRKWGDKEWVCNMLDHVISMHSSNIYILEGWIKSYAKINFAMIDTNHCSVFSIADAKKRKTQEKRAGAKKRRVK